jgi:hypothetical protein
VLYLQMTMYGSVERGLVDAFRPTLVVSDRHAVVDTLAYGPVYRRLLAAGPADPRSAEELLRMQLARDATAPLDAVVAWHRRHARRSCATADFWDLPRDVMAALDGPHAEVLREFCHRYEAGLPDLVVMLDVDPDLALRRCVERGGAAPETHETGAVLTRLRDQYLEGLAALGEARPELRVRRIDVSGLSVDDSVDAVLACIGGIAAPPQRIVEETTLEVRAGEEDEMLEVAPQRVHERTHLLTDAAVRCFAREGVDRTTMLDVAREAGVCTEALYRYFDCKEALIRAIAGERGRYEEDAALIDSLMEVTR